MTPTKKTTPNLFQVYQHAEEFLRGFMARFNEAYIKIAQVHDSVALAAFHHGLQPGKFFDSLSLSPPVTFTELLTRAMSYLWWEDLDRGRKRSASEAFSPRSEEPAGKRLRFADE
ncbi:hypothetical protein Dimus_038762 [Dionaea muscipula]